MKYICYCSVKAANKVDFLRSLLGIAFTQRSNFRLKAVHVYRSVHDYKISRTRLRCILLLMDIHSLDGAVCGLRPSSPRKQNCPPEKTFSGCSRYSSDTPGSAMVTGRYPDFTSVVIRFRVSYCNWTISISCFQRSVITRCSCYTRLNISCCITY